MVKDVTLEQTSACPSFQCVPEYVNVWSFSNTQGMAVVNFPTWVTLVIYVSTVLAHILLNVLTVDVAVLTPSGNLPLRNSG